MDMGRVWIGSGEDKPAILNVWIKQLKEALDLREGRTIRHGSPPGRYGLRLIRRLENEKKSALDGSERGRLPSCPAWLFLRG